MVSSIAHPTDFSPQGIPAFELALSLALANRCRLDVLHVDEPGDSPDWDDFPQVRQTLQRWGKLQPGAPIEAVHETTGVKVRKVGIHDRGRVSGLANFLEEHQVELIVMATRGRAGIDRLLNNSVTAGLVQALRVPTVIIGPAAQPIVDPADGRLAVRKVLVPVDHDPDPNAGLDVIEGIAATLDVTLDIVHVGSRAPALRDGRNGPRAVRTLDGPVVETLLAEAQAADLVAMPMVGAQGLVDALKGSTTERLMREVTCPVLALPVARQ
jgi:nucleotide-binding universal stress UspA family protein